MAELISTKIYGDLTVDNVIKSSDGNASLPSYSFGSDTDTGIYLDSTGVLGFSTAGTERMKIDTSDITSTVTINAPQFLADTVNGSVNISTGTIYTSESGDDLPGGGRVSGTDGNDLTIFTHGTFSPTSISKLTLIYRSAESSGRYYSALEVSDVATGFGDLLLMKTGGNVGIGLGASSPTQKLHVGGNILLAGDVLGAYGSSSAPTYSFSNDSDSGMYMSAAGTLRFSVSSGERLSLTSTALSSLVSIRNTNGSQSVPSYSFTSSTSTGMYSPTSGVIGFSTALNERMRIDSSGNVGIGTSTLSQRFVIDNGSPTWVLNGNQTNVDNIYLHSLRNDAGGSEGDIGGSISFSGPDNGASTGDHRRHAAIAGVQTSPTETDYVGLAFFTHNNTVSTGVMQLSMTLSHNANLTVVGSVTATDFILSSDVSLKENLVNISDDNDINYYSFNFKSDENKRKRYGVVAQEIQDKYPELVSKDKDGKLSVSYIDLLITEIANLKNKIKDLENKIV